MLIKLTLNYSWCVEIDSEKVAGEGDEELYRWLEEIDMPKEAAMASVTYLGPPIFDS